MPSSSGPSRSDAEARREPRLEAEERYGILIVERYRKDDGRALLLYRREEPQHG